ncbi:G-PROTEIN-RECEP-F3-4 domain-containing protein [Aphelenchoides fujianensis]|nr:G-PROTEIN-RECEP-F3-4 domain-containing protein [Aphelenchoides fujianensis]
MSSQSRDSALFLFDRRFRFFLSSWIIVFVLLPAGSAGSKCAVFDAFKVLPENSTNFVGGAFALHAEDCTELLPSSVQEIVALQWVLSHWNVAQKATTSQIGLYVGDSCSRPKESVLQSLRFLDFVDFFEPHECTKKPRNGSVVGLLAPKDRPSATALAGLLQSTNVLVGAYTASSAEALLESAATRVLVTVPLIDDYVSAFSALMTAMESDLLLVVTCDLKSPRLEAVLRLLKEQELHVSEVIHLQHDLLVDVLSGTDSRILLYLPCESEKEQHSISAAELPRGPKLIVTIGIQNADAHFPLRISGSQEIIIRQTHTDLPRFKPYLLRILTNNYDTYALASSYIQQLMNCSFVEKTCPPVNMESLSEAYVQGENVDGIVRLAYAFAVAGRFVDVDPRLKESCATASRECLDGIFTQLTSMRFVHEKRGPLELANEELGFFPKSSSVVQSIGLRLEAVMGGSEEIFKYVIAREPKLVSKGLPAELRSIRSVCQPYHTYCGQCDKSVLADRERVFLNRQQVSNFYVAGMFDLHGENCEEVQQNAVINALAFTHTINTMAERFPALSLRPMKEYSAFLVDGCSESFRTRQFTIDAETQCMKLPLSEYNVSIPAGTVLGYLSALNNDEHQSEHIALLRGMRIPAVSMTADSNVRERKGVLGFKAPPIRIAQAVTEFLVSMHWDYVSVVVSADDPRSRSTFEEFAALAAEYEICVGSVLFYSPLNRSRVNVHQTTNVTVFFATAAHTADFVSTRLRSDFESGRVDVMVGEAQDFYLQDPINTFQHAGTVAIKPKDILPGEFKHFLSTVTPLSLPEDWFWAFVERRWRCALSLQNRAKYEGRMCTGDELLNVNEFGRMGEVGYLIRGLERLLVGLDSAFQKACGSDTRDFCPEFLENGRKLLRAELDAQPMDVEFEVEEFVPLDHHGNLGYRRIGNFTADGKYNEIDEYRHYVGGILKSEMQLASSCVAPLCICTQRPAAGGNKRAVSAASERLGGRHGGMEWFYADQSTMLLHWEESTLNYVLLATTATILCVTVLALLLILWKVYTRVIKGNQALGILSLMGIVLFSLTACLIILDGKNEIVGLRQLLSDMAHVACFGVILIKAIRLRNAEDLGGERKAQIGYWNYLMLMFFVLAVQAAIHLHRLDSVALEAAYAQTYIAVLLLLALWINVRNREIRRNYKESKWLFIANLVALLLYASWAVVRSLVDPAMIRYVDIAELNLMGVSLLFLLFGSKVYILLFYEPYVVERCMTPMKPPINEDDLFGCYNSADISTHSNVSRKGSLSAHRSASVATADEFPVLKTVLRKKHPDGAHDRYLRTSHSSDRHSSSSNCS